MTWLVLRWLRRLFSVDWDEVLRKVRDHQPRLCRMPDAWSRCQETPGAPKLLDWKTYLEIIRVIGHE